MLAPSGGRVVGRGHRGGAWTTITYPHPVLDQATGAWISRAEVAETTYTAFSSMKKAKQVTGMLGQPRIPPEPAACA